MREVIHRVDRPAVALAVVGRMADAVEQGVPHHHVGVGHVDSGPKYMAAVGKLPRPHPLQQVQVLRDRATAPWALHAGLGHRPPSGADLLLGRGIHIGQPSANEQDRALVQLAEVVGSVVEMIAPVVAQPPDVALHRLDVLGSLGLRIRVVKAQVAAPARVLGGDPEVEVNRLGMAYVQVAVGLRREAGNDAPTVLPGLLVPGDHAPDEVHPVLYLRPTVSRMRPPPSTRSPSKKTLDCPGATAMAPP